MMTQARKGALAAIAAAAVAAALGLGSTARAAAPPLPAEDYADAIAEQEQAKADNEAQQEALETELEDTNAEIVEANDKLHELNERLPVAEQELAFAEKQLDQALFNQKYVEDRLAQAEADDAAITKQLADDEARLENLRAVVAELARAAYRGDDSAQVLRLMLGAATTDDFVAEYSAQHTAARTQSNALAEMEQIAAVDRNLAVRQEAVQAYIEELKVQADQWVDAAEKARKAAEERKAEIEALLAEQQEIKDYLKAKKKEYLKQQKELDEAYDKIRIEILKLTRLQSGGRILSDGTWAYPTSHPYITSPYGWRLHPIYGTWRLHTGTDFRAYCGTPIMAAADGQVIWAKWVSGYGNEVLVNHGKIGSATYMSSYNHLTSFAVHPNDYVLLGDVIGYSGTTGSSTACHLHFEVFKNGSRVDPMSVLPPL